MAVYYNEIDPFAAEWLRQLMQRGAIADGFVDERSITEVQPQDLHGFTQVHFFAGIGVWSYALRLAGVPDTQPVWTGSCPCQPFSQAGKGKGTADERHLWPEMDRLIRECRPPVVIGEQVASPDGLAWLDLVLADLESAEYAAAAADMCAAGIGAPHIRQRLYWVGHARGATSQRHAGELHRAEGASGRSGVEDGRLVDGHRDASADGRVEHSTSHGRQQWRPEPSERSVDTAGSLGGLADDDHAGLEGHRRHGDDGCQPGRLCAEPTGSRRIGGTLGRLADGNGGDTGAERQQPSRQHGQQSQNCGAARSGRSTSPLHGHWSAADWLFCRDGKWRPVEPGTFPLVNGAPARVGRLRGYGNGIVAEQAALFIKAAGVI